MELELSRMAFLCDLHRQWCALPSLAEPSQFPHVAVRVHWGLNGVASEKDTKNVQLRKLPFLSLSPHGSPPTLLLLLLPSVPAQQKTKV